MDNREAFIKEINKCKNDLIYFAERYLQILDKAGKIVPFKFNRAQKVLHAILEKELREKGMIRAAVLKGRQEGVSTYIAARYYHKTIFNAGTQTMILTHEQAATNNLFGIVQRFHRLSPDEFKPETEKSNARVLQFKDLFSGYRVATAGAKGTGRSSTSQLFHGSEVAFWSNPEEHMAGIGQAVSGSKGTEIILETTGNGINYFHSLWKDATDGKSDFLPIFLSWFLCDDYKRSGTFVPDSDEEKAYQETYKLSDEQMLWRRYKVNNDFKGDVSLFNQEYPASPLLAFYRRDSLSFIATSKIDMCNSMKFEPSSAKILAVDPAEFGDDNTCIVIRHGRKVYKPETWGQLDLMDSVGKIARVIQIQNPDAVMVLANGVGAGVWSRLKEIFPSRKIYRIMEGESAVDSEIFSNKRAEMWSLMRDFINDGCELPNDPSLDTDLATPLFGYDSRRRLRLERKEDMRSRGAKSPDRADALAATFAVPVESNEGFMRRVLNKISSRTDNPMAA